MGNSINFISQLKLSKLNFSVLPRTHMNVIDMNLMKGLNLRNSFKSVALVGGLRSGKTIYISNYILNDMLPWWHRLIFPPRGFFLVGSQSSPTINAWLKGKIGSTGKHDPWVGLKDLLSQKLREQRMRMFLLKLFKTSLPSLLTPQPTIIIVDDAECLLVSYRADFLVELSNLKEVHEDGLCRLILVVNTENAVKSLNLLDLFECIQSPKISRNTIVEKYGEQFAKIFEDCDGSIGIALEYHVDPRSKVMSAKEYAAMWKDSSNHCLSEEITEEEYHLAKERSRKSL
jgi:hypothetical protein